MGPGTRSVLMTSHPPYCMQEVMTSECKRLHDEGCCPVPLLILVGQCRYLS